MKTFDEWYLETHGDTFEKLWLIPMMPVAPAMLELCRAVRDYATYAAQFATSGK